MAKNEVMVLTREAVSTLTSKELKKDLNAMLKATETGNKSVWDYAKAISNIIATENFDEDFENVQEFCKWAGLNKSKVSQYCNAVTFMDREGYNTTSLVVANAYKLSTITLADYPEFVKWCESKDIDIFSLSVRGMDDTIRKWESEYYYPEDDTEAVEVEAEEVPELIPIFDVVYDKEQGCYIYRTYNSEGVENEYDLTTVQLEKMVAIATE